MARKRSPARLVIALSVAMLLAVFLLYTSTAGGTLQLQPSELAGHAGVVSLTGKLIGKPTGDAHGDGLRFVVRDVEGGAGRVAVVYKGSVPDMLKADSDVTVQGKLSSGVFVAKRDTLITKCPSKYQPAKKTNSPA